MLNIYDGGSEYSTLIANFTVDNQAQTTISSIRNQMFVTFDVSTKAVKMGGFRASIEKNGRTLRLCKNYLSRILNLFCKF